MKRKTLSLILAAALFAASALTVLAAGELDDARDRAESAEGQVKDLNEASQRFAEYLDELNEELNRLTSEMAELEVQRGELESQLADTSSQLSQAKETEEKQYESMKKRIQYMYENRDAGFISLVFSEDDLSSILNRAEYAVEMASYDRKMLTAYKETKELVAQKESELLARQEELDQVAGELTARRDGVLAAIAETSQRMEDSLGDLEDAEGILAQYRAELQQRELEAESELLAMEQGRPQSGGQSPSSPSAEGGGGETGETGAGQPEEPSTGQNPQEPSSEGTVTPTEPSAEAPTEPPTEAPTEAPTEPPTEAPTEPPTEAPTEPEEEEFDYSAYSDLELVAAMIYREANMEPWEGKVAVGNVIMNRLNSSLYPNTIIGVLSQPYQFSPWGYPKYEQALVNGVPSECTRAAQVAMAGSENYVGDCLHFRMVAPGYDGIIIGNHVFY